MEGKSKSFVPEVTKQSVVSHKSVCSLEIMIEANMFQLYIAKLFAIMDTCCTVI